MSRRRRRWWLGGGEVCRYCLCTYALEMECRCEACDRAICSMCAVRLRGRVRILCPDCPDEGKASDRSAGRSLPHRSGE